MAEAGRKNLSRWREAQDADGRRVREAIEKFSAQLREEVGANPSAIADALIQSVTASYGTVYLVSVKLSTGYSRLDRVKDLHSLLVEAQRVMFRSLRMLVEIAKPEADTTPGAIRKLFGTLTPAPSDQGEAQRLAVEAQRRKFAILDGEIDESES